MRYSIRTSALFLIMTMGLQAEVPEEDINQAQVFRANVNLVQLDVTVTDSEGRHITDLTKDEFVVIQDGVEREITSFSPIQIRNTPVDRVQAYRALSEAEDSAPITGPFSMRYERSKIRRVIAMVVDRVEFPGLYYARLAMHKWVEEEMQPGDLVAVINTKKGIGTLQQFTTDPRMLKAQIDNLSFDLTVIPGFKRDTALHSIVSLEYIMDGLKELPGRKSLIIFSSDMQQVFDDGFDRSVEEKLLNLVKEANKSAVVIHVIEPQGLRADYYPSQDNDDFFYDNETQDGMVTVSKGTGGLFKQHQNDIDQLLSQVVKDGEAYYLVGYQPDAGMAEEMKLGIRKHHSFRVRVKRPGMRVRIRKHFMGSPKPPREPVNQLERMEAALYSPFATLTLPVRVTPLYSQTQEGESQIFAQIHFDASGLNFTQNMDETQNAEVELAVALFDIYGQQIEFGGRKISLISGPETYDKLKRNGIVARMSLPAKKPGFYKLKVVVSEPESGRVGTDTEYIEVPDLGKGHLAVSGIALARENDSTELGVPFAGGDFDGTSALRIFNSGDTISWAYQILNATFGEDNRSRLQAYVNLYQEGQKIYAAEPAEIEQTSENASGRLIGIGQMQLQKILPGRYDLQVMVRDMLAKDEYPTAAQSIHFEIRAPGINDTDIRN